MAKYKIQNNILKVRVIMKRNKNKYVIIVENKSKYSNDNFNF